MRGWFGCIGKVWDASVRERQGGGTGGSGTPRRESLGRKGREKTLPHRCAVTTRPPLALTRKISADGGMAGLVGVVQEILEEAAEAVLSEAGQSQHDQADGEHGGPAGGVGGDKGGD